MRRMIAFSCEGATLIGSLDLPDGAASGQGVLLVTGGRETRFGSHRLYERLALELARAGHHAFRFDRRGTGDSDGEDPGYEGNGPDIAAALVAFRRECPNLTSVAAFGLCDGATALALHAPEVGALILANPWLVERRDDLPPAAAIGRHYRAALLDPGTWKRLLTGAIDLRKAARGVARLIRPQEDKSLAVTVLSSLASRPAPVSIVIADGDATGQAAQAEMQAQWAGKSPNHVAVRTVSSRSHSFAGEADFAALMERVRLAVEGQATRSS